LHRRLLPVFGSDRIRLGDKVFLDLFCDLTDSRFLHKRPVIADADWDLVAGDLTSNESAPAQVRIRIRTLVTKHHHGTWVRLMAVLSLSLRIDDQEIGVAKKIGSRKPPVQIVLIQELPKPACHAKRDDQRPATHSVLAPDQLTARFARGV